MSIAELFKLAGAPALSSHEFVCPDYSPLPNDKRCKDYLDGGACARADRFLCEEWLRRNRHQLPGVLRPRNGETEPVQAPPGVVNSVVDHDARSAVESRPRTQDRDLFGNEVPIAMEPRKQRSAPPELEPEVGPAIDVDQLRGLTSEDIEGFRALGVEVQLSSETYGELWLVPVYTSQPRKEITPEHAATVMRVLSVFPGSRVVAFEKSHNHERPERQENRS